MSQKVVETVQSWLKIAQTETETVIGKVTSMTNSEMFFMLTSC